MPEIRRPGVYIGQQPTGPRPIIGVDTSETALVGCVEGGGGPVGVPGVCGSFAEFAALHLGGLAGDAPGGLVDGLRGFFENGGARAWVLRLEDGTAALSAAALAPLNALDGVSLVAAPGFTDPASHAALAAHCVARGDRFAVLDMAEGPPHEMARPASAGGLRPERQPSGLAAAYAPALLVSDPATGAERVVPASGHVCGIYARTDRTRGVWKSPSGAEAHVAGVTGLTRAFSEAELGVLTPEGVNLIRRFDGDILVWGGRTLAESASDYRYVNVRRLALYIERSLRRGLQWAVFEPNDAPLWATVRRLGEAFLMQLWREGALVGATPREAFTLRCDETTMTQDDLDNGRLVCLIGIAAVKPAEFVLFRIGQKTADAA